MMTLAGKNHSIQKFVHCSQDLGPHDLAFRRLSDDHANGATYRASVDGLSGIADVLSFHCPALPEKMTAERLALLPEGAVIVNNARGALIDDAALMDAMGLGHVAAAGLDCFKVESGGNRALFAYDNVFMLPHIGSATRTTRDAVGFRALDNLYAFFAGKTPQDKL